MTDEGVLERWLRLEGHRAAEGIVSSPLPLSRILVEASPATATRGGGEHRFDREAARRLAQAVPAFTAARLRLPILFYLDRETPGSCFVSDEAAQEAVRALHPSAPDPRGGRLWLSEPLARELGRRFPTLAQFAWL